MLGSIILIVLGILLLLNNLYPEVYRFSRIWPVVLIVIGFVKLAEYFRIRNVADNVAGSVARNVPENIEEREDR